jgi:hypothetical protein
MILFKIKECAVIIPRANQLIIILSKARRKKNKLALIFLFNGVNGRKSLRGSLKCH